MNKNLDNLLTQVYELEGLLLVMQRHNDDVPQVVIDRFKQKAHQVACEAGSLELKTSATEEKCSLQQPQVSPASLQPPLFKGSINVEPEAVSEPSVESPVVKDEPPACAPAVRDIASAFSINDRFLFQRELFDGDANRLDETLALMQKMRDMNQVQRFMTDDLQWDTSDDVVKEFIRLIGLSFKQ